MLDVEDENTEVLNYEPSLQPIGKRGKFPPGNPKHMGPDEVDLRQRETETLGREQAAENAWKRAEARKSNQAPKEQGRGPGRPRASSDFKDTMSRAIPPKPKEKPRDIHGIAKTVQFAHAMLAMKLERADFAISEDEAYMLTKAACDLLDYYGIKLAGKNSAWSSMIFAITMVYGPRLAAFIMERMKSNVKQAV